MFARYQRSPGGQEQDSSLLEGALSTRMLIGRTLSYGLGLDAYAGGGKPGASYGGTAYLAGIGLRSSKQDFISARAGVGADALHDLLPFGISFRSELRGAMVMGPLRPLLWFRPSWQLSGQNRAATGRPFNDYEAGVWLAIGAHHRYWQQLSTGGGPAIGFSFADRGGVKQLGFWLGLDFVGGE